LKYGYFKSEIKTPTAHVHRSGSATMMSRQPSSVKIARAPLCLLSRGAPGLPDYMIRRSGVPFSFEFHRVSMPKEAKAWREPARLCGNRYVERFCSARSARATGAT
jgi:hypothetical protein